MPKKFSRLLALILGLAVLSPVTRAQTTPTSAASTPVQADLQTLTQKVVVKNRAKQNTAEALAPEIAEYDALVVKYHGDPEAATQVLLAKAAMTIGVLKDEAGAVSLYVLVVKDYPGAKSADFAKQRLHALSAAGKTEIVAAQAALKAQRDALTSGFAPDFIAQSFQDGREVKLSDYRGKVVVLDFWASWCGPCKAAMPHNQEVAAHYKDQDVVIFAVCVWDERSKGAAWLKENQAKYPDLQWAYDPAGRADDNVAKKLYGVTGIPEQFIIGRDGKLVGSVGGYVLGENALEAVLSKAGVKVDAALVAKGEADLKKRES